MAKQILFLVVLFTISPVFAEAPELAGNNELRLQGSFDFQGPNGDNIDLIVGYGWFLRDDLLVGGEFQWALIEDIAPGEKDYRAQQFSLIAEKWYADDRELVPYIGLEIGFRNSKFNDLDESGMVFGGRAGLRYFLSDSVSVNGSLSFLVSDKDVFIVDFEAEDQYLYPSIGISAVF